MGTRHLFPSRVWNYEFSLPRPPILNNHMFVDNDFFFKFSWGILHFDVFVFFPGKILVLLRDGRKLLGILRSFDQFGIDSELLFT